MTIASDVLDLVRSRAAAEEANDSAYLDRLLGDDFVGVGPVGYVLSRGVKGNDGSGRSRPSLTALRPADRRLGAGVHIGPLQYPAAQRSSS